MEQLLLLSIRDNNCKFVATNALIFRIMRRFLFFFLCIAASFIVFSCGNNLKPKEGRKYVQIDKGLMLPVPSAKDTTQFDYSQVKVTFETDGVYLRSKEMMSNVMMSVEFKEPQYKTTFGTKEYNTRIGLEFKDLVDGWNVYYAPYSQFKKYTPYWTWDDVKGIRFVYEPESFNLVILNPSDFENIDDYIKAERELGFQYEITIYRDYPDVEMLNDPDFESVFKLFKAHMQ